MGDGAYMFANPMVAHWVSDVHKLPILTIVFNNSLYGAVRGATMSDATALARKVAEAAAKLPVPDAKAITLKDWKDWTA